MRKLAIAGVVAVAAALPFLGGTVESRAAEGPWCHTYGGSQGTIENCRLQTLEMCRFEIQGNGGHQIRIGQAIRSRNDGSHNRPVCTPSPGANAINPSADYFGGWGSRALSTSSRDAKLVANLVANLDLNEHPRRIRSRRGRASL